MKCQKAQRLISEFIDGRLSEEQEASLQNHIRQCPDCQKLVKDFEEITEETKHLDSVSPSPGSWWKIQKKLREEKAPKSPHRTSEKKRWTFVFSPEAQRNVLAAALLLVIVVGAALIGVNHWNSHRAVSSEESWAKLEEAERHYRLAIEALQEAVTAQKREFNPELIHVYQRNLEIINQSIQACKQAVHENPENMEARHYLLAAYRQKVDFLNEMIKVPRPSLTQRSTQNSI